MPIYEYKCNDCGKVFETLQKFSDKPLDRCEHCNGKSVEKLLSRSSFVLKGTGWYATDYASKNVAASCPAKEESKDSSTKAKPDCSGCPSNNQ